MSCRHWVAALLIAVPAMTQAQQPKPRPVQPPRQAPQQRPPTGRDTLGGRNPARDRTRTEVTDTTAADTAVKWSEPDSVMSELLKRSGYVPTRYEGSVVTFDALTKAFAITSDSAHRAQVEREGQHVVTDSTIVYRDPTKTIHVTGNFKISPGSGQQPIAGIGSAEYNVSERSGRLTNAAVTVEESGQSWYIHSDIGKTALGDSTRGIPMRFYGLGGSLTSCDDSIPDYHFQLREIKRTDKTLVARPAVLYIRDVPVMWLPFVFQDIRRGRRSGILPPRFSLTDIVRNNPSYRRHVENLGYYWAMSNYFDLIAWVDWRSAAGGDSTDPGWYRLNSEWKYFWMSRFVSGSLALSYLRQRDGFTNTAVSWRHDQKLGRDRAFHLDGNYVTSTRLQRQNTLNPIQAMATIRSSFNYSDKLGPASLSVGGTRTQYPGRSQIDQSLPSISLTTAPLALASWLVWRPNFAFRESDNLRVDQASTFNARFLPGTNGRLVDTVPLRRNVYYRELTFGTPITLFGTEFANNVTVRDRQNDFPQEDIVYPHADSALRETRTFARTFRTEVDWNPQFSLPPLFQNRFKLTPSVTLANVDSRPFWVRTELSNGEWVHGSKRLTYGLSATPTLFGLWPGFGPFTRIRHSITPVLSYSYAPQATVNTEYLAAWGDNKQHYFGALAQNAVSLGLSQNFEAKVRSYDTTQATDVAGGPGQKLKLLSMNFTSLSYDFERARVLRRSLAGLTTPNFGARMTSDLIPGFDLAADWSLFQGSTQSDTAEFKPFLTRVTSTFRISQRENPFTVINRLFGRAVSERSPAPGAGPAPSEQDAALAPSARRAGHRRRPTPAMRAVPGRQSVLFRDLPAHAGQCRYAGVDDQRRAGGPAPAANIARQLDQLRAHPEMVGRVADQLRFRAPPVREPDCVAAARPARLARELRLHALTERQLRLHVLHRAEAAAGPEVRL